jgi:hypothetical protein
MKIIISESQELDVKKKFIFMLLNNKNYNLVEIGGRIYFAKNIGDNYGEIRFNKSDGWCGFSYRLILFLSSITGFQEYEVQRLIGKWVEHTLQMEPTETHAIRNTYGYLLVIPYN